MPSTEEQAVDAQASVHMKRGIGLLARATARDATEALACFDQALSLRSTLEADRLPRFAYSTAACWLNRAEALTQLGRTVEAVHSCDQAMALLRGLPLEEDPRYRRRLALAHQNRGLALAALGPDRTAEATRAFNDAIDLLSEPGAAAIADRTYMLAVAWLNLANLETAVHDTAAEERSLDAALRALALVSQSEEDDVAAAEIGLKARHIQCQRLARRLSEPAQGDEGIMADVHAATDAVDNGLSLVRRWEARGVRSFQPIALGLFQFGAMIYQRHQPQFLEDFLKDHPTP